MLIHEDTLACSLEARFLSVMPVAAWTVMFLDDLLRVGTMIVHHADCSVTHTSNESIRVRLKDRAVEKAKGINGMSFENMHQTISHGMGVVPLLTQMTKTWGTCSTSRMAPLRESKYN